MADGTGLTDSESHAVEVIADEGSGGDGCAGLADGVHFSTASSNEGKTWTASVDAKRCEGGSLVAFGVDGAWVNPAGSVSDDCGSTATTCTATQSGIRKNIGSAEFGFGGLGSVLVFKP